MSRAQRIMSLKAHDALQNRDRKKHRPLDGRGSALQHDAKKCVMREDGRSSRTLVLEMMTIPVGGDYQDSQESRSYCGSAIASDTSATCLRQLVAKQ